MAIDQRNVPSAKRGISSLALAAVFATAVQPASAQPVTGTPAVQGESLRRVDAMLASNLALSPENQAATTFRNVVSLNDPDVVAQAQTLSNQAGHNGLHYDYFRFKALFYKARRLKADKIDIPASTYRIYPPANLSPGTGLIDAAALSHVVIEGHGATLLFASIGSAEEPLDKTFPRAGIRVNQSDHVTLRNLVLDWYEPLVVPVRVGGSGQPGAPQTLTVDPAYPIDPAVPIPIRVILPYNVPQRKFIWSRELSPGDLAAWQTEHSRAGHMVYLCGAPAAGAAASVCFRYTGGQTYAFGANEHLSPVPPHAGNFLGSVRDNNFGAVVIDGESSFVTVSGVTIYSSPGQGLVIINAGKAIHVTHVRVVRKPDALLQPGEPRRLVSALSDGMDVISSAGDVVIEDSEIGNQADDGLNIRAAQLHASGAGPHSFSATSAALPDFYRVGGLVDLYDAKGNNLVLAGVPITAIQPPAPGSRNYTVTVASSSPALQPGSAYQVRVRDFDSARVIVQRTWFHDNTERGVVVHDDSVAIVGNRFDHTGESAVQVLYDNQSGGAEGAVASNLVIAGNLVHDVNTSWFDPGVRSFAAPGAIAVYFSDRGGFPVNANDATGNVMARHLAITDNIVNDVPGAGILVSQADDVILERNAVLRSNEHAFGLPVIDGHGIVVERTTHLKTNGNTSDMPVVIAGQ